VKIKCCFSVFESDAYLIPRLFDLADNVFIPTKILTPSPPFLLSFRKQKRERIFNLFLHIAGKYVHLSCFKLFLRFRLPVSCFSDFIHSIHRIFSFPLPSLFFFSISAVKYQTCHTRSVCVCLKSIIIILHNCRKSF
jgi:hypothetical protein